MSKYGILLMEGYNNASQFNVVTEIYELIAIEKQQVISGQGIAVDVPTKWAHGVQVEDNDWTQEKTDIILDAANAYNLKYPDSPLTPEHLTKLTW